MGLMSTLDRVRVVLAHAVEAAKDGSPYADDRSARENEAYGLGAEAVREEMLDVLDVGERADNSDAGLADAARAYCWKRCPVVQGGLTPGEDTACTACPLRPYTVDGILDEARDVAREAYEERHTERADTAQGETNR